jgi:hypothetical protein
MTQQFKKNNQTIISFLDYCMTFSYLTINKYKKYNYKSKPYLQFSKMALDDLTVLVKDT